MPTSRHAGTRRCGSEEKPRHGKPLDVAEVQLCQERGLAGATVSRCVEGYGAGHHLHTARLLELSENLPVRRPPSTP
jgi:PII-like signaling protein